MKTQNKDTKVNETHELNQKYKVQNTETIKKLRDEGFRVDITHYRRFASLAPNNDEIEYNYVNYSRKNRDIKNDATMTFGNLLNTGGLTVVEIYKIVDDFEESYFSAESECSVEDQFQYSTGTHIALERAMEKMN